MTQFLYNTLSGKKEKFEPKNAKDVKMYLCGPTVYDFLHIGNFRGPIVFNLIRNWLEFTGYKVTMVYNYTDIDDKIIQKAIDEKVDSSVISEKFIKEFEKDFNDFGLRPHDLNPRVTEHVTDIVAMIEGIIKNGQGYVVDGEVFYAIDKFKTYGALSKKKLDELTSGERVEVDERKQNPHDFVLWKPAKAGEPSWDSPWGKGRPGWHIECSAMIKSLLGDTIDIHGGGVDLIFPHHENEIAQSEACNCTQYCKYWMHNEFINFGAEKMSKSLGNIITARNFNENYHPEILKYLFLSAHYRTQMAVTDEKILQTISALSRIYSALELADNIIAEVLEPETANSVFSKKLLEIDAKIKKSMNDDFNSAELISLIFEAVRNFNALGMTNKKKKTSEHKGAATAFKEWMEKYSNLSALFKEKPSEILNRMDEILIRMRNIDQTQVESLVAQRIVARSEKDWDAADKIRDELADLGVELFDGHDRGWRVKINE